MPPRSGELAPVPSREMQGDDVRLIDPRGGPVVVVLASDSLAGDAAAAGDVLRAELRGLGATLVLGDPDGYCWILPDDPLEVLAPDIGVRFARLVASSGEEPSRRLTVLVIDPTGTVRFRHSRRDTLDAPGASAISVVLDALRASGRALRAGRAEPLLVTRRDLIVGSMITAFGLTLASACRAPSPARAPVAPPDPDVLDVALEVNGRTHALTVEPRATLLDVLRARLGLTGTKKGCDHGQCGACTVLVNERATLSCLTLAAMQAGARITTIEGLARGPGPQDLHPMQAAFVEHDAYQCGYCTPGQILSAVALVAARRGRTDDEIREHMSGNLCRCGAYPNIVAAIRQVHGPAGAR